MATLDARRRERRRGGILFQDRGGRGRPGVTDAGEGLRPVSVRKGLGLAEGGARGGGGGEEEGEGKGSEEERSAGGDGGGEGRADWGQGEGGGGAGQAVWG